jgi:hypothetical protein
MVVAEPIQRMQRLESASTQYPGHFEPTIEVQNFLAPTP